MRAGWFFAALDTDQNDLASVLPVAGAEPPDSHAVVGKNLHNAPRSRSPVFEEAADAAIPVAPVAAAKLSVPGAQPVPLLGDTEPLADQVVVEHVLAAPPAADAVVTSGMSGVPVSATSGWIGPDTIGFALVRPIPWAV
jgi:hypothetical protein